MRLSLLQPVLRWLQGGRHCCLSVPLLKVKAWQAAAPALPFTAPLAPQRAQGALVMPSVKSHSGCAGKCKEQQRGPGSLFWQDGSEVRGGWLSMGSGMGTEEGGRAYFEVGECCWGDHYGEEEHESIVGW